MERTVINSIQNPRVKTWRKYQKNSFRRSSDRFMVEGGKECIRGINSHFEIKELIICPEILPSDIDASLSKNLDSGCEVFEVSPLVYAKLAYRGESEGVIGIFSKKQIHLESIRPEPGKNNLFLIVENVEKPGNLGAILRTADAVGARAVILAGKLTDPFNPNVIRASLGTYFSVPLIQSENEPIEKWAEDNAITLYAAALPAYTDFYALDFTRNTAFVFGTEHDGLSAFWIQNKSINFSIPMYGIADSLNLSVSVAVVSYEYLRRFPK